MSNTVTVTESNNTVSILEDAPIVTPQPWYKNATTVPTSNNSVSVTAGGTSHTKGAWTEIIASNAAETSAMFVFVSDVFQSSTNTATLLDLAVGASGAEVAFAENIAVGAASGISMLLPIKVGASVRVSARTQAVIASDTATVEISTLAMGDASTVPTSLDVIGTSTGTSRGTDVGTSYTEIIASTSQSYAAIAIVESYGAGFYGGQDFFKPLDVAIGPSGSETLIATKNIGQTIQENAYSNQKTVMWLTETSVPAGSRLSAKTSIRTTDVTVIGIPVA